jgi:hypothetical protein
MSASTRETLVEGWLAEGRARPSERDGLLEDVEKDAELAIRMMSRRSPDPILAREYGRSDRLAPTEEARKKVESEYASFMAGMGLPAVSTQTPAS